MIYVSHILIVVYLCVLYSSHSVRLLASTLPTELGLLTNLKKFNADNAGTISGSIPSEFGNFVSLVTFDLYNNHLTGTIPSELSSMVECKYIDLAG